MAVRPFRLPGSDSSIGKAPARDSGGPVLNIGLLPSCYRHNVFLQALIYNC